MTCSYVPGLSEQLHGPDPTAGSDCAICCARMAIKFATCGDLDPSPDKIREMAGLDEPNPPPDDYSTTMSEYARALNSFDDRAYDEGYEGIGAAVHERESWDDQLAPLLRAEEKWATVFLNYGKLNDMEPDKSGDKNFRGSHAVGFFGFTPAEESGNGKARVKAFDPLCDGRSNGIPKGPVWWNMETLKVAARAYTGGDDPDAVTWCATPRSKLSDPPDPSEPEQPDPCAQTARSSDLSAMLEEAREELLRSEDPRAHALAVWIRKVQGNNPEGLTLPVHSGVKPDRP